MLQLMVMSLVAPVCRPVVIKSRWLVSFQRDVLISDVLVIVIFLIVGDAVDVHAAIGVDATSLVASRAPRRAVRAVRSSRPTSDKSHLAHILPT